MPILTKLREFLEHENVPFSVLPVLVDELLAENDEIVFNAGTHTLTAKLRFADFRRLVQPRIASLSVPIG
jgi:prolyl-tRNA editing enzyme YbaK/EbsC (Cys-tRNA(Pro) deacylase)